MSPVHCFLCCKISTQPHLNTPSSSSLFNPQHSLTDLAQTNVRHAWLPVCSFTHTHTARWVKCPVSHLMKRHLHTNRLCLCRERPFYSAGQCLCWLFFVRTFLSTKSSRKNEKKESERHAIVAADMFRLIQAPYSYLQTIFYSTIMLGSLSVQPRIWWRYVWAANLALAYLPPLTHKRHFTL